MFVGAPVVFGGWAYAPPYYYYRPPAYYYPSAPYYPPVYIEREYGQRVPGTATRIPLTGTTAPTPRRITPTSTECPGGWQQVLSSAPAAVLSCDRDRPRTPTGRPARRSVFLGPRNTDGFESHRFPFFS